MSNKSKFNEVILKVLPTLEKYVPVVDRVHGDHHPEFHEVRKVFNRMTKKIKEYNNNDIRQELEELSHITTDYKIPSDVCETYEAVYNMLKEIDDAYQS